MWITAVIAQSVFAQLIEGWYQSAPWGMTRREWERAARDHPRTALDRGVVTAPAIATGAIVLI